MSAILGRYLKRKEKNGIVVSEIKSYITRHHNELKCVNGSAGSAHIAVYYFVRANPTGNVFLSKGEINRKQCTVDYYRRVLFCQNKTHYYM